MSADSFPPSKPGARGFLKNVLGGVRKVTTQAMLIDKTPGVRWQRKHFKAHHGDPSKATRCSCKGCLCSALVVYGLRCHPCIRGRHRTARMSRGLRRLYAKGPVIKPKPKHGRRWRSPEKRKAAVARGLKRRASRARTATDCCSGRARALATTATGGRRRMFGAPAATTSGPTS